MTLNKSWHRSHKENVSKIRIVRSYSGLSYDVWKFLFYVFFGSRKTSPVTEMSLAFMVKSVISSRTDTKYQ